MKEQDQAEHYNTQEKELQPIMWMLFEDIRVHELDLLLLFQFSVTSSEPYSDLFHDEIMRRVTSPREASRGLRAMHDTSSKIEMNPAGELVIVNFDKDAGSEEVFE